MKIFILQTKEKNFTNGYDPIEKRFDVIDETGKFVGVVRAVKDVILSKGEMQMEIEIIDEDVCNKIKSIVATKNNNNNNH